MIDVETWEDDQFDPEYWERECHLEGDEELDFRSRERELEESVEPVDE